MTPQEYFNAQSAHLIEMLTDYASLQSSKDKERIASLEDEVAEKEKTLAKSLKFWAEDNIKHTKIIDELTAEVERLRGIITQYQTPDIAPPYSPIP